MRVPAQALMSHVTMNVTVTGINVFKFRLWVAGRLMSLSARIAGCGLAVNTEVAP